jgi:hypothetical protein
MTDAIRALRLAVEVGKLPDYEVTEAAGLSDAIDALSQIMHGNSLDAALALMKAVLPGWGWVVQSNAGAYIWREATPSDDVEAEADTPARALLLAVLKALDATAPASQSPAHLGDQEDSQ